MFTRLLADYFKAVYIVDLALQVLLAILYALLLPVVQFLAILVLPLQARSPSKHPK